MLAMRSPRRKFTPDFAVLFAFLVVCAVACPPILRGASTNEFNAYHNAITKTDPSARAISLELFLKQYPAGDFAFDAEQLLLLAYSETGNIVAALPRAQALLHSRPSDPTALALLADDEREQIEAGSAPPTAPQQLQVLAAEGLRSLPQFVAPASISPFEFQRLKSELTTRLKADAGFAALRLKQFPQAQSLLEAAVKQSPNDFRNVYQLALAYLTKIPPDNSRGFAYLAQAAKLANGTAQQQIVQYGRQLAAARYGSVTAWDPAMGGNNAGPMTTSVASVPNTSLARSAAQSTPTIAARPIARTVPGPPGSVVATSGAKTTSQPAAYSISSQPLSPATAPVEPPALARSSPEAGPAHAPVSLGILVDGSVLGRRGSSVRQSLKRMASALNGNDEAFLIDFGNGNTFEQDLTGDPSLLDHAFDSSAGRGRVALYDAIVVGAQHLARIARNKKKALLVIADRQDSASANSIFQATGAVENVPNLSVYVVAIGDRKLQDLMADFTHRIAGSVYNLQSADVVSTELASLTTTILGPRQAITAAQDNTSTNEDSGVPEGGGIGLVRAAAGSAALASHDAAPSADKPLSAYTTLVVSGISINGGQQTSTLPGGEDILLERLLVERLRRQTSFSAVVDGNSSAKYPRPPVVSGTPIVLSGEITQFEANAGYSPTQSAKMHVRFVFRDASGKQIFASEDDGEVKGTARDLASAETETLLQVADSLVREINQNR